MLKQFVFPFVCFIRDEETHTQHPSTWKDSVYQFVFEGNCSLILASPTLTHSFLDSVKVNLADELSILPKRIYPGSIHCGSIIFNVTIEDTDGTQIDDQIMEIIASGNFSFSINTTTGTPMAFQAAGVKVLTSPSLNAPAPWSKTPTQTEPFEDSLLRGFWELSETERILIIVFSVLGGFLFIMALAYIVHTCCLKGQSKSFDLGDTPDHQVKLEDFTLTKLQRPPTIYDEHGMILTEDLHPGQTKMAVPYISPSGQASSGGGAVCCQQGHATAATFRDSPVVLRRANNSALHGSSENLVTHHDLVSAHHDRTAGGAGIDNMSFSSDDILGDGNDGIGSGLDSADDTDNDDDDSELGSPRHRGGSQRSSLMGESAGRKI